MQHLAANEQRSGLEPEFYRYQETLVKGEIERLQREIDQLQDEYPNLQNFITEQFRQELLAIEADAYAEFVRVGRLNRELAPLLGKILAENGNNSSI